jgi:hypothetical protein
MARQRYLDPHGNSAWFPPGSWQPPVKPSLNSVYVPAPSDPGHEPPSSIAPH